VALVATLRLQPCNDRIEARAATIFSQQGNLLLRTRLLYIVLYVKYYHNTTEAIDLLVGSYVASKLASLRTMTCIISTRRTVPVSYLQLKGEQNYALAK